jgi:hypothetical protein
MQDKRPKPTPAERESLSTKSDRVGLNRGHKMQMRTNPIAKGKAMESTN